MQARGRPSLRDETATHRPEHSKRDAPRGVGHHVRRDRPCAHLGGMLATGLVDVTSDISGARLHDGWWAVVLPYDSRSGARALRRRATRDAAGRPLVGPSREAWSSSMSRQGTSTPSSASASTSPRATSTRPTSAGCSAPRARPSAADVAGLAQLLSSGNPAPYAGFVSAAPRLPPAIPDGGVAVATASPELFLNAAATS